jgi:N4-gp56 family major capsid protein
MAELNTQTTLLHSVGNDLSPEMKTFYSKYLLDTAKPNLVHTQFGKKTPIPRNGGKVIEWRRWSPFKKALNPLQEGVTPNGTPINVGYITKEVKEYGDYTTVSDLLDMTAIDNVILEVTERHADNAALTLDTIVRNELNSGTQVMYHGSVAARSSLTASDKITAADVLKAVTQLRKMNAPTINGKYVAIIHPSVAHDLMQDTTWVQAHTAGGADSQNLYQGEIGELYGCRFIQSTEAKVFKSSNLYGATSGLTIASVDGKILTIDEALTDAQARALAGREILITDGASTPVTTWNYIVGATAGSAGSATLELVTEPTAATGDNSTIAPGGAGASNAAVYGCIFLGRDAYGIVDIEGAGIETIVKGMGSAGTADPLNQRSTIGWKIPAYAAKILQQEYIVRLEVGSTFSGTDEAN